MLTYSFLRQLIVCSSTKDHECTVSTGARIITNFCFADDFDGLALEEEELAKLV